MSLHPLSELTHNAKNAQYQREWDNPEFIDNIIKTAKKTQSFNRVFGRGNLTIQTLLVGYSSRNVCKGSAADGTKRQKLVPKRLIVFGDGRNDLNLCFQHR